MKTVIFYFSGTGNCLKVARDLAQALGDTQVKSIPKLDPGQDLSAFGRVGIVYPVYMFGLPLIVADFIGKLKITPEQYVFTVATYGGKSGSAPVQVARLFGQKGICLCGQFGIKMPGNYTPLYGALPAEKQQELFRKEQESIEIITSIIRAGKEQAAKKDFFLFVWLSGLLYNACSPKIPFLDKKFWSSQRCNSCGVCVRACPVGNIELSEGKPKWLHRCQQCMACLQWCPQEAIEYGKSTVGRKRYHHPAVKLQDILDGAVPRKT